MSKISAIYNLGSIYHLKENYNKDVDPFRSWKDDKVIPWDESLEFYKSKEWQYARPLIHHYFKSINKHYCFDCGMDFNIEKNRKFRTIDHIIPLRNYEGWERRFEINDENYSNLQMACKKCNEKKAFDYYYTFNKDKKDRVSEANKKDEVFNKWWREHDNTLWNFYLNKATRKQRAKHIDYGDWVKFVFKQVQTDIKFKDRIFNNVRT